MSNVRIRFNYTPGAAAVGSVICIQMDSTGVAGDGILQGNIVTISDGVNAYVFTFDPNNIVPYTPGSLIVPVRIPYGSSAKQVQAALYEAIRNSPIAIDPSPNAATAQLHLTNKKSGTAGNVAITQTLSFGTLTPVGMANGTNSTGHSRWLAMAERMNKLVLPLGADQGNVGQITISRMDKGLGGNTASVQASLTGCIIQGYVFERLVQHRGEIVDNLLQMTLGATSDSLLLVDAMGATGTVITMTPTEIQGYTGGYAD